MENKVIWMREDIDAEIKRLGDIAKSLKPKKAIKKKKKDLPLEQYKGKDGYRRYLKSNWWKKRKAKYWKHHNRKCHCCGDYATTIHHKNYSRLMEELDKDFVPVCDRCHREIHKLINNGCAKLKNAHTIFKRKYVQQQKD